MSDVAIETEPAIVRRAAPRRGLSESQRRDAVAIAEALWSRDGSNAPPSDRLELFADDLSHFAGCLNLRARLLFLACLGAVTFFGPLVVGRLGRMRSLPIAERIAAIHALERTPAGLALYAAKAILSLVWWEQPDNARELAWDQRCKRSK